jgi:hypothetical protein
MHSEFKLHLYKTYYYLKLQLINIILYRNEQEVMWYLRVKYLNFLWMATTNSTKSFLLLISGLTTDSRSFMEMIHDSVNSQLKAYR